MTLLRLAWTLLAASLWASGSSQDLQQEPIRTVYPKILSTVAIECDCANFLCDSVYWFRSLYNHPKVEFLGRCNNADRQTYADGVDSTLFKLSRGGSTSFMLTIINVTEKHTGIYSCVLKDRKNKEMWKPGVLLRPGVTAPTSPPKIKPKPPVKSVCRCSKNPLQVGCGSLVLWPLVGLIAALALALICTLYYFSRLPKICRHNFGKRR